MTKEQLDALKDWTKALIDSRISYALGRDGLHESVQLYEAEKILNDAFAPDILANELESRVRHTEETWERNCTK